MDEKKKFSELQDSEIEVELDSIIEQEVVDVFGQKIARALIAIDWKFKEHALKFIYKNSEKTLDMQNTKKQNFSLEQLVRACVAAVSLTIKEKVIKVFTISLQLLNMLISCQKIEKQGSWDVLKNSIVERNIVLKLL